MRLLAIVVIAVLAVLCVCVFAEVGEVYKALIETLVNAEVNPYERPELFVVQGFVLLGLLILVIAVALLLIVLAIIVNCPRFGYEESVKC